MQPARYKGAHGGRGSGKSHFFAEMVIEESICGEAWIVCIREYQKSLDQSVKKLLEDKIKSMGVASRFQVQHKLIRCDTGGEIHFEGMQNHTAESIKSLEGYKFAWVEEAQNLSERSLEMLRPTIRMPNSQIWFSWNPKKSTDPVDQLLRGKNKMPDSAVVEVNYVDNPWFEGDTELVKEMEYDRRRDIDRYNHIWLGQYQRNSEARVFRNWRVEEFDTPADTAVFRFGADWGYSIDPTVLVRTFTLPDRPRTLFIDREAYKIGCEIEAIPVLFDGVDPLDLGMARKWPLCVDSSRPDTISFVRRHGYSRITPSVKGAKSVEEGIEFLRAFDIVIHPRCKHTIEEFTLYSYKVDEDSVDPSGRPIVLPALADKDNHVIDSCRYAVEAMRRGTYTLSNIA